MAIEPSIGRAAANAAERAAGWVLAAMLLAAIAGAVWSWGQPLLPAACAWVAAALLFKRVSIHQRVQTGVLAGVGVACLAWARERGVPLDIVAILAKNQIIISLIAAVSLLRLLNRPLQPGEPALPRGSGAYARTMLGVNLFGAVINVSALVIFADRLSRAGALAFSEAALLVRSYTMAVFYSPFIGGMALALAYTPGSRLSVIMLVGIPLALCGFLVLLALAKLGRVPALDGFRGYPIHFESLWLPGLLAGAVLLLHTLQPSLSVLSTIVMLTPAIVVAVLCFRHGAGAAAELASFVSHRLPEMSGELVLFLGAGVLAAGLVAFSASLGGWTPFDAFDAGTASTVLVITLAVAFAGLHPVIVVSTAAPMLAPLSPEPSFMAMLFVMCWGIGCAASPYSGTNLLVHARYRVGNWRLAWHNAGFCVLMTACAIGLLHAYEAAAL